MENIKITTANKYVVEIRPFLTYDQFITIKSVFSENIIYDLTSSKVAGGEMPASALDKANKVAVSLLVIDILNEKGAKVERKPDELPLPVADGIEVMEVIERISSEATAAFDKKKAKT